MDANRRPYTGSPPFITRRGRHDFALTPHLLRQPMEVAPGLWAEANLSSNHIADRLRLLLGAYGLPLTALRVFLHTDRDA